VCYTAHTSCPRDLTALIISGKQLQLWSPSLCYFLHPPGTSSLLGRNSLLSIVFKILNLFKLQGTLEEGATLCRARRLLVCYVVSFYKRCCRRSSSGSWVHVTAALYCLTWKYLSDDDLLRSKHVVEVTFIKNGKGAH
jgi:hypothetical protein